MARLNQRGARRGAVNPRRAAWLVALALAAAGCELIVDFDRTKIDAGGGDGSVLPDVTQPPQDGPTQDVAADNVTSDVLNDVQASDAGDAAAADDAADAAADASDGATE